MIFASFNLLILSILLLNNDQSSFLSIAIDKNDDWSLFNNKIDSISKLKEANIINGLG